MLLNTHKYSESLKHKHKVLSVRGGIIMEVGGKIEIEIERAKCLRK